MNRRRMTLQGDSIGAVGRVEVNAVLRELLDATKAALGPGQPTPGIGETAALLSVLLATIDRAVPRDAQLRDRRVINARKLAGLL